MVAVTQVQRVLSEQAESGSETQHKNLFFAPASAPEEQ